MKTTFDRSSVHRTSSGAVLAQDLEAGELHSENAPPVIASARTLPTKLDRS